MIRIAVALALLLAAPAAAQSGRSAGQPPPLPPEAERDSVLYTLRNERHGVSFFPRVRHPQVEYEAGEVLTFDHYHTVDVMYAWLRRWAERYPNIVELYEVGRSYEGREILQVTLTNKETGAPTEKPAAFFEGGRHSGEITSSESVLWLIQHLVQNYGRDPRITHLLDTKAIHLRPQNNPDGSNLYLHTHAANRSSVRPIDSDNDGLLDEDEADDLDGDGVIYQIRWKPTMQGADTVRPNMIADPRDPSGRLLRQARAGETAVYRVMAEGLDNDGDGRINEDGIGGLDLHRNYPENWRPMPGGDLTGRGFTQGGAGEFPLSEPETRAVVLFLLANPNVAVVNSMDTRVPMHLRAPSTSKAEERMYPEDLRYYEYFDSVGLSFTNYPWAGDVYYTYATRGDEPEPGEELQGSPLFGHGPDFGYWYYGAIWYGDELWNGGIFADENEDGERDQLDALIWDDRDNEGDGFMEWKPFRHPVLGDVEIGGVHPKFFSQNGPPRALERWAGNQARFNLEMALHLPELKDPGVDVRQVAQEGDSTTYEVTVRFTNAGRLPTSLRQAQLVKIVRPDRVELSFEPALTRGESPKVRVVSPYGAAQDVGITEPGETKTVRFQVRTYGVPGARGTFRVISTRGGVLSGDLTVGTPVG
jgi:hypothetical protein